MNGKNSIDPRTPQLLQIQEQIRHKFALARVSEHDVWEVHEVSSGRVVLRVKSEDVARRWLAQLNDGTFDVDV